MELHMFILAHRLVTTMSELQDICSLSIETGYPIEARFDSEGNCCLGTVVANIAERSVVHDWIVRAFGNSNQRGEAICLTRVNICQILAACQKAILQEEHSKEVFNKNEFKEFAVNELTLGNLQAGATPSEAQTLAHMESQFDTRSHSLVSNGNAIYTTFIDMTYDETLPNIVQTLRGLLTFPSVYQFTYLALS